MVGNRTVNLAFRVGPPFEKQVGTFEECTSSSAMNFDMHRADVLRQADRTSRRPGGDDQLWTFIPILIGAAVVCLLMFFLLAPSFKAEEPVGAKAPPAETAVTKSR
jgi:hypothetical protein